MSNSTKMYRCWDFGEHKMYYEDCPCKCRNAPTMWRVPLEVEAAIEVETEGRGLWEGDICEAEYRCLVCDDSEPHNLIGTIDRNSNGLWMFDYGHGSMSLDDEDLTITKVLGNLYENTEIDLSPTLN